MKPEVDFVIHGHFYQPPRENPWTGEVPEQPAAAPYHDWNERITAECYRPNAERGVFEHMSFNVGPTLMSWLEEHQRPVYDAIRQADRRSGRAIAQAYGHAILPLCNDHDRRTQVRWGIIDFEHRFGRRPEGMWLPETAADDASLAVLAEEGIRFTILAPGQVAATRPLDGSAEWVEYGRAESDDGSDESDDGPSGEAVPIDRALRWNHPDGSGRGLDLVVYDGQLAQAIAFSEPSAESIVTSALVHAGELGGLLVAATDGETFGHHHRGADEVLHEALLVEAPARGVAVPRLLDALDARLPAREARVRTSSWSCVHGVERWKSDCGCHTGGRKKWNQAWRAPLREALDVLRDWGVGLMDGLGSGLLADPWAARDAYLSLLLGATSWDEFAAEHVVGDHHRAGLLLEAQRNALLMYTSCGWFFNDLAGVETVQILRYAARAVDLYGQLGSEPPVEQFLDILERASSNAPAVGDGRRLWRDRVVPQERR